MADPKKDAAKAAKKQARQAKRGKRKETFKQFGQAFNLQRKQDKWLIPLLILSVLAPPIILFLIGLLFNWQWFLLILGIPIGLIIAMIVFSRRLQNSMYDQAADQPGAAGWTLDRMRNTVGVVWFTKQAVSATHQMDVVHRVVGVPGIVLVSEGNKKRVSRLVKEQKRRLDKVAGGVPVHTLHVGQGEDDVPLKKLQRELLKLPRAYRKNEVYPLNARIEAMDASREGMMAPGMPKGPVPGGGKVSGMNRRARRSAERNKKG